MKRFAVITAIIVLVIGGVLGYRYYSWIFHPAAASDSDSYPLLIPDSTSVDQLATNMTELGIIDNRKAFMWVAERMSFTDGAVKMGRYLIPPGSSNREIIQMLRLGEQAPVQMVVRASLTLEKLAGRLGKQLMIDSAEIRDYIVEEFLPASTEYDETSLLTLIIPNTYEVYWNISAKGLVDRLQREHDRFWNDERLALAAANGLEPEDVYILASIIERETQISEEREIVAGLYLNRLELNMPLQSDPTVQYAHGDFGIRRVLYKHLEIDSPYNTYKNPGLPPGPIAMPSMASLEAVLQPADHNYLYFCVNPESGGHLFAESLTEHNRNASRYHNWLDSKGIR